MDTFGDFFFVPKVKPPQVPNQTALSDLQERADAEQAERLEQQRLEAEWKEWQQKMQEDYERVLAFEKQAVGNELKIESWQRFLSNWTDDNPYSQQDSELRSGAQAKVSYWRNDQKVESKSNPETEVVLSGDAAKKRLLETKGCVGCNFSRSNLSGFDLNRVNLGGANLSGSNLTGAVLIGATLKSADLSEANLYKADLSGAYLRETDLRGAAFCETKMPGSSINNRDC